MENSEAAQGMNLQVNKLSYGINIGRSKATFKTILKNVSFSINSGSLCALMGPSGSGKSTLLDLLAGRKTTGEWSGEVLFNNKPRSKWFNRDSAYVLQDDLHIPTLTVRETVYFSAWVRLPEHTSKEKLDERVDTILKIMKIDNIEGNMVGGSVGLRGISGSEMKRLSIAVEIVSLPTCIFLDEPTSGLDSEMAFGVISTVRGLCNGQKTTCIATIHQPAQRVFDLFDTVILIAQGHLIYFGPASTAVDYFCKHNFDAYQLTELKLDENPAEVLLEISESLVPSLLKLPGTEMNESNDGPTFLTADYMEQCYCQSELKKTMNNLFYDSLDSIKNSSSRLDDTMYQRLYATGSFTQFQMLLYRSFLAIIRDKAQLIALSVKSLVAGLATAAIFYNRGKTELPIYTSSGLPNAGVNSVSAMMFYTIFYTMVTNLEAVPFLCSRYAIYQREIAAFAYDVGPYWLAQSIVMVPILFISAFIYINACFFLIGFPREWEYYIYFQLVLQLSNYGAYYFVTFLSAATNNAKIALQLFPIYFMFSSVFTGYSIHVNNFPPMWKWATWIVPFRWGFQGAMFNHWKKYDNDVPEDKKTVLGLFGYPADWNKYYSLLILLGITGIMLFLTYLAMLPAQNKLRYVDEDKLVTIQQESNTTADTQSKQGNVVDIEMVSIGIESPVSGSSRPQRPISTQFTPEQQQSLQKRHSSRRQGREDSPQKFHRVKTGKTLSFNNIHYLIEQACKKKNQGGDDGKNEKLHILKGISGIARAGQLMALMGPSGAGKSTLLDILADRKTTGLLKGDIFVNNQPRTAELMKKQSAYVMQDDSHHLPNLTVRETLMFASWLRLPHNNSVAATTLSAVDDDDEEENGHVLTTENASQRVDEILEMLNLTEVANNLVGGVHSGHRGISGGQRKRLSIGVEIIHLPKIIFLDEATTGLDSSMAFDVIRVLRSLAAANRTIICTIHQPSASCFDLFDTLLLLAKGRCAYYGNASTAQPYFMNSHYGFKYSNMKLLDDNVSRRPSDAVLETIQLEEPESRSNPADFFMSVASGMVPDRQGEMVSPEDLAKLYEGSDEAAQLRASIFAQQFHYSVNNNQVVYDFNDEHQTTTVQQTDVEGVSKEVNYQALESNVLSTEPYRSIHHYNQHYDRQVFQNNSISISQHHKQLPGSGNNSETSEQTNSEVTSVHSFSMTAAFLKSSTVVNPLHWQVRVLLYRLWMNKIRNYRLLILNSVKYMIAASFFGSILYRNATLSGDSYEAYTQRLATFFYISTFILVGHEKDIPNFIEDRPLLYREVSSNAYTRFAYWLSRNMIELPFMMIDVLIYSLITYKMTSLRGGLNSEYFGYYLAIMYLHDICCFMLWQIIAGISATAQMSMSLIPLTKFFLWSFQGFFVYISQFENYLVWGPYIDFMRYVTQALMLNELQDNPDLPLSSDFIEQLGFDKMTKNDALYALIGFTIGLSIISSLVMNYISYEKQ